MLTLSAWTPISLGRLHMRPGGPQSVSPTLQGEGAGEAFFIGRKMNAKVIDMTGKRFASITAVRIAGKSASGDMNWLFLCDCGNEFITNGYFARSGQVITCPTCSKARGALATTKHGLSDTVEFGTWVDIQTRCYNKNAKCYENYGGRGIKVCQKWLDSFANFLEDMGPRPSKSHSIDRYPDNDGDYEPSNCRWATRKEQANNKRSNHRLTINGETKSILEWSEASGLSYNAIWYRLRAGKTGVKLIEVLKRGTTHGQ